MKQLKIFIPVFFLFLSINSLGQQQSDLLRKTEDWTSYIEAYKTKYPEDVFAYSFLLDLNNMRSLWNTEGEIKNIRIYQGTDDKGARMIVVAKYNWLNNLVKSQLLQFDESALCPTNCDYNIIGRTQQSVVSLPSAGRLINYEAAKAYTEKFSESAAKMKEPTTQLALPKETMKYFTGQAECAFLKVHKGLQNGRSVAVVIGLDRAGNYLEHLGAALVINSWCPDNCDFL